MENVGVENAKADSRGENEGVENGGVGTYKKPLEQTTLSQECMPKRSGLK